MWWSSDRDIGSHRSGARLIDFWNLTSLGGLCTAPGSPQWMPAVSNPCLPWSSPLTWKNQYTTSISYTYCLYNLFQDFPIICGSIIQVNSTSPASSLLLLGNRYNEMKGFPSGLHIPLIAWFIIIRLHNSDLEDLSWLWSTGVVPWDSPESGKEFKMADNSSSLKVLQATHKMGFSI